MDEEKKSESSWDDVERVGPYQLHEQVELDEHKRGELFLATHETSGASALVLKAAAGETLPDWRVRCISSASPGYIALEVEDSHGAAASDTYSVETLVYLFDKVRNGLKRMAQALPDADEPRLGRRLGLALVGAVAVGVLALALGHLLPGSPPPGEPDPLVGAAPALLSDEVPTDITVPPLGNSWVAGAADGGQPGLALPFPRKPYKGQKRPPCTPRVEVEIMGACWVPHKLKAPCPEELYEYKGECYTTSMLPPPPPPQSLGQ